MKQDRFLRFSALLNDAQKSLNKLKCIKMESYGLGSAHTVCISILQDNPNLTNSELTKLCCVDKAQITRIIGDLLEKEYVAISTPERNYRQKYRLTDEGERIAAEITVLTLE